MCMLCKLTPRFFFLIHTFLLKAHVTANFPKLSLYIFWNRFRQCTVAKMVFMFKTTEQCRVTAWV